MAVRRATPHEVVEPLHRGCQRRLRLQERFDEDFDFGDSSCTDRASPEQILIAL
jgi:hypothetical protein